MAKHRYEVSGKDEDGDTRTFATNNRAYAKDNLSDMLEDLSDAKLMDHEASN